MSLNPVQCKEYELSKRDGQGNQSGTGKVLGPTCRVNGFRGREKWCLLPGIGCKDPWCWAIRSLRRTRKSRSKAIHASSRARLPCRVLRPKGDNDCVMASKFTNSRYSERSGNAPMDAVVFPAPFGSASTNKSGAALHSLR